MSIHIEDLTVRFKNGVTKWSRKDNFDEGFNYCT